MAQTVAPTQDIVAWASGSYASIDETSPDDADKVVSDTSPANDVYVTKFGTLTDPVSSTGHILSYRIQKSSASATVLDATVELRQAYVSEASKGTLISTYTHAGVANGWTTYNQTLAGAEADAITNYGSLYLRVVANTP